MLYSTDHEAQLPEGSFTVEKGYSGLTLPCSRGGDHETLAWDLTHNGATIRIYSSNIGLLEEGYSVDDCHHLNRPLTIHQVTELNTGTYTCELSWLTPSSTERVSGSVEVSLEEGT